MSLTNEERQTLVQRELSRTHEAYEDIEILKASKRWNGAANRLYYAVFHAVGHKVDAIRNCDKASFCVIYQDCVRPAEYTTYFRSV